MNDNRTNVEELERDNKDAATYDKTVYLRVNGLLYTKQLFKINDTKVDTLVMMCQHAEQT